MFVCVCVVLYHNNDEDVQLKINIKSFHACDSPRPVEIRQRINMRAYCISSRYGGARLAWSCLFYLHVSELFTKLILIVDCILYINALKVYCNNLHLP